ncbi:AraC family transcriptional regulator [Sediminibacter sp. Hel_I_10]|uniref:helix-turn-helix domain-containing protein n=1 Tax=Sediminibacter sp. Hel_I_10 TaxID=1392490 RepID=UPI00068BE39D|nr:AraC family transcriptional regulator [Sediminibacter sp. Hel_I_10]
MKRIDFLYNPQNIFERIIDKILNDHGISYDNIGMGQVVMSKDITSDQLQKLQEDLTPYAIKVVEKHTDNLVEQIKDCMRMIVANKTLRKKKISVVLSEKLGYNYAHLSKLFSNETFTSIEKFYIFLKIEKAKELLMNTGETVAEVANDLDYSSTSHLSRQFKNVTGLTVSQYLKLIDNRK